MLSDVTKRAVDNLKADMEELEALRAENKALLKVRDEMLEDISKRDAAEGVLRLRVAVLEGALKPFSHYAEIIDVHWGGAGLADPCPVTANPGTSEAICTVGDLRRARAALTELIPRLPSG